MYCGQLEDMIFGYKLRAGSMALGILLLCKRICQRLCLVPVLVGGSLYEKQLQSFLPFHLGADEWEGRLCWGKAGRLSCAESAFL